MSKLSKISSSSEFVTLRIKKDTLSLLKQTKLCYEFAWPEENVTYDTVLMRLLESGVKRLDPSVHKLRENILSSLGTAEDKPEKEESSQDLDGEVVSHSPIEPMDEDSIKEAAVTYESDDDELEAWFKKKEKTKEEDFNELYFEDDLLVLREEDEKYACYEPLSFRVMRVGEDKKLKDLYDFDEQAQTHEEKEKASRLLATYRRRLDIELDKITQAEKQRLAEEEKRNAEYIAAAKAPFIIPDIDRKIYEDFKTDEGQQSLNEKVMSVLKDLEDRQPIIIEGKELWASDGKLTYQVRKEGRFMKVTNWENLVKQPSTFGLRLYLK